MDTERLDGLGLSCCRLAPKPCARPPVQLIDITFFRARFKLSVSVFCPSRLYIKKDSKADMNKNFPVFINLLPA